MKVLTAAQMREVDRKTIEAGMKNLPAPRTSFVGRASELDEERA